MPEQTENNKPLQNDEIDLIEVFKKIWAGRKTIYKSVAICFVLGLIIAIGTPKEYKSEVTLLAETNSKDGGGLLGQLGGIAGLNLNAMQGTDALTVDIYPLIVKSTPFLLEIMKQKVFVTELNKSVSVAEFLDKYTKPSLGKVVLNYTVGLPWKLLGKPELEGEEYSIPITYSKESIRLSKKQSKIAEDLTKIIKFDIEKSGGNFTGSGSKILKISVEVQDPLISSQLADSVVKCLRCYVIDYYTGKAKNDLEFITARYTEAYNKFVLTQQALANYKDRNFNVVLSSANAMRDRLQAEYNIAFNVFNTLSQQLEQAKIKVQDQTPVFTVINPAEIPLKKSKPHSAMILVFSVLLSILIGVFIIFVKQIIKTK